MANEKEVPESVLEGSPLAKDLKAAAETLGGKLSLAYDSYDMSYRVLFTSFSGHTVDIGSLEALEDVYGRAEPSQSDLIDFITLCST